MKKNKQHSFAGMSVLQPGASVDRALYTWIMAQGVGLLGNTDGVFEKLSPKEITPGWKTVDSVGRTQPMQLRLPVTNRRIKMGVENDNGDVEEKIVDVKMPILNPGVAVPRITDLSPEQRKKLAAKVRKTKGTEEKEGTIGSLYNLLLNWDVFTDEQKDHMIKNRRNLLHLAAAERGELNSKKGKRVDKWSQQGQFYVAGGFTPNKGTRRITALPEDSELKRKIAEKYYQQLLFGKEKFPDSQISDGSVENVNYFLRWAKNSLEKNNSALTPQAIELLHDLNADLGLSQTIAALLVLNLNNPDTGVYDPELELTGVSPETSHEKLDHGRYNYTFNFCHELSQIGTATVASRRARRKGSAKTTSLQTATSGKEGSSGEFGDTLADKGAASNVGDVTGLKHATRRHNLNPLTSSEEAPDSGLAYPIARLTWRTPEINHELSKFFQTKRKLISTQMPSLAGVVDKVINDLDKAKEELEDRRASLSPELKAEQDEYMHEFFINIINGKSLSMPQYDHETGDFSGKAAGGRKYSLSDMIDHQTKQPLDAKGVINLIKSVWSKEGADQYSLPLLMAIRKHFGKPIDQKQAEAEIMKAGGVNLSVSETPPTEAPPTETPPTEAPPTAAQPAVDTNDELGKMLAELPNNTALWKQLEPRFAELRDPKYKVAIEKASIPIRKVNMEYFKTHKFPTEDEMGAYSLIINLMSGH